MKYRRLNSDDLHDLREDFVQFLAANSITAQDWVTLKEKDSETAHQLIDLFSDIVWEKALSKMKYLELRTPSLLRVFHFSESGAEMIEIQVKKPGFDFTDPDQRQHLAEGKVDFKSLDPEVKTGRKVYEVSREKEVFAEILRGAKPCEEVFWLAVKSMLPKEKEKK